MNRISLVTLAVVGLSSNAFGYGSYGSSFSGNADCDTPSGKTSFDAPKIDTSFTNCDTTPTKSDTPYCNIKTTYDFKSGGKGGSDCNTDAVPEPASMIALAIGGVGLLRRRNK